ncbi:hypothetical protein BB561_006216 [Smittium simulii]|uniref:tRNA (uracil-O(2)-)-methyltransferase n=1 Tax=Smittium simulii TaxID=133385 RepID=A0A2T9Y5V3_9FUNG|nr:hypothetical protein BB561_006216 [Smittium simulii]
MSSRISRVAADAIDMVKEAARLKAYSSFKPIYYFDSMQVETPPVGSTVPPAQEWRLLAKADAVSINLEDFKAVMLLWANDPTKIYPPVHAATLLNQETTLDGKNIKITRKLLPKRKDKDCELIETVSFQAHQNGLAVDFIPNVENENQAPFFYPKSVWKSLFEKLFKWSVTQNIGFVSYAKHDSLVPKSNYEETYNMLKLKYADDLIENWVEKTDPKKFVYEDLAIASWLISLWSSDTSSTKKPTFADLGCGNGLLVYILAREGYSGYGIDQSSRRIWSKFSEFAKLDAQTINPERMLVDVDWIIGNHADELVPWIPIIAAKSGFKNFVIIPCCYHGLTGDKMTINVKKGESKYGGYVRYVASIIEKCGYQPERDFLRIPSTRNTVLVGRSLLSSNDSVCKKSDFLKAANDLSDSVVNKINLRIPDSLKSKNQLLKQQERKKARLE